MYHVRAGYDAEEPVQALSVSTNQEFAALACRTHVRTCELSKSGITASQKFQLSAEGGANFIMTDVAWGIMDIERIAASANNGSIVVFNGNGKFNRMAKQEWSARESTFAVNRINWHNSERLLISAHQNGEVKLWDISRQKQSCMKTYTAQANNFCKDAKFDPLHPHILAAIYESGFLVVWDRRNLDQVLHRIPAHTESGTTLAWSPSVEWVLATGSRDKTVKIWDLGSSPTEGYDAHHFMGGIPGAVPHRPINVIVTPGSVNRIAWRPHTDLQTQPSADLQRAPVRKHFHIATGTSDKGDVSVWDASSPSKMPACIMRGIVEGCVGLCWFDTPLPSPSGAPPAPKVSTSATEERRPSYSSTFAAKFSGKSPKETDSGGAAAPPSARSQFCGLWQHVAAVSKDGKLAVQDIRNGYFPQEHFSKHVVRLSALGHIAYQRGTAIRGDPLGLVSDEVTQAAPGWYADDPEHFGVAISSSLQRSAASSAVVTPTVNMTAEGPSVADMSRKDSASPSVISSSPAASSPARLVEMELTTDEGGMSGGSCLTPHLSTPAVPAAIVTPGGITVGMGSIEGLTTGRNALGGGAEGGAADPVVIEALAHNYRYSCSQPALDECREYTLQSHAEKKHLQEASPRRRRSLAAVVHDEFVCMAGVVETKREGAESDEEVPARIKCAVEACHWNSIVATKIGLTGHASMWMALMTLVPAVVSVHSRQDVLKKRQQTADEQEGQPTSSAESNGHASNPATGPDVHASHDGTGGPEAVKSAPLPVNDLDLFRIAEQHDQHSPYGSLWQLTFAIDTTRDLLTELIDCGDCQHFVTCCEIFREIDGGSTLQRLTSKIGDLRVREGYVAYLDMLNRLQLFVLANAFIKNSSDSYISRMSRGGVILRSGCAQCGKELNGEGLNSISASTWCQKCRKCAGLCVVCQRPVRGLLHWCPVCGHGGHLECTAQWFEHHVMCPSGCGHKCIVHGKKKISKVLN